MMKHITILVYTKLDDDSEGFYQRCEWIYFWENRSKKISDMVVKLSKELDRNRQEIFTNIQVF